MLTPPCHPTPYTPPPPSPAPDNNKPVLSQQPFRESHSGRETERYIIARKREKET